MFPFFYVEFFIEKCLKYVILITATPDTPGQPIPEDWSANHCELKWEPPISDGGSPIVGYIVEKKDKYSPMWEKAVETQTDKPTAIVNG